MEINSSHIAAAVLGGILAGGVVLLLNPTKAFVESRDDSQELVPIEVQTKDGLTRKDVNPETITTKDICEQSRLYHFSEEDFCFDWLAAEAYRVMTVSEGQLITVRTHVDGSGKFWTDHYVAEVIPVENYLNPEYNSEGDSGFTWILDKQRVPVSYLDEVQWDVKKSDDFTQMEPYKEEVRQGLDLLQRELNQNPI
jgi:hypothetical protein